MGKKQSEVIHNWPLAPKEVNLNRDTDFLKLIAMLAMLCDHMGKMLFPEYRAMRWIGRIAFPIYAYCITVGCVYTRNPSKYLGRVLLLAMIAQPIYAVSMAHTVSAMYAIPFAEQPIRAALNFYIMSWNHPSILFALALGIMLIWALREKRFIYVLALSLFIWLIQGKIDYGVRGIALMLLFYIFCRQRWLSLVLVLAFMLWWGLQGSGFSVFGIRFSSQLFAIGALPLIYAHTKTGIKLPKWVFYAFYPAHLILIYVLTTLTRA